MYINSPGGGVTAGLAILDTMNFVKPPVYTYCIGQAASMAAILLANGKKGKRFSLPHTRIMIHQPHICHMGGQVTDIQIAAKEIQEMKDILIDILAERTGQDRQKVADDVERDFFMRPQQAIDYGLIDTIKTTQRKSDEDDDDE
jgi:ATP-dependent Clp protease protease subunit